MTLTKPKSYRWATLWILWMGLIFLFSSIPGSEIYYEPTLKIFLERKAAHLFEFFVLFLLTVKVFSFWHPQESLKRILALAFVWAATYGALDELHQFFTPYRGAHIQDIFIDIAGILLALLPLYIWSCFKEKK